jgi:hypothetical protein
VDDGQNNNLYSSTHSLCHTALLSRPFGVSPIFLLHQRHVPGTALAKYAGFGGIL